MLSLISTTAASSGPDLAWWEIAGVLIAGLAFVGLSPVALVRVLESRRKDRTAADAARIAEERKQAVEEATGVDPRVLAKEVAGLKRAVLGSEGDEWEGPTLGLRDEVTLLKTGLADNTDKLKTLSDGFTELSGNFSEFVLEWRNGNSNGNTPH